MTREEALDTMGATLDDWIDKKNMHMLIDKIYVEHEAQIKEAYIDGSNSTNELIQSLYKQIEQLKDNQCY